MLFVQHYLNRLFAASGGDVNQFAFQPLSLELRYPISLYLRLRFVPDWFAAATRVSAFSPAASGQFEGKVQKINRRRLSYYRSP